MKYFYGFLVLCACILTVDWAVGTFEEYRKERKRQRDMDRYSLSPFRGTKKFDDGQLS